MSGLWKRSGTSKRKKKAVREFVGSETYTGIDPATHQNRPKQPPPTGVLEALRRRLGPAKTPLSK